MIVTELSDRRGAVRSSRHRIIIIWMWYPWWDRGHQSQRPSFEMLESSHRCTRDSAVLCVVRRAEGLNSDSQEEDGMEMKLRGQRRCANKLQNAIWIELKPQSQQRSLYRVIMAMQFQILLRRVLSNEQKGCVMPLGRRMGVLRRIAYKVYCKDPFQKGKKRCNA